jgi:transcriptional regulator with XRE-family HTH domain
MKEKDLSAREVGIILDVSHTTVLRALRGDAIDLQTLLKIAEWLNIRPSALLDSFQDEDVDARIEVLVNTFPELREVLEKAVEAIEAGRADPAIIKDIASYAEYRIKSTGG